MLELPVSAPGVTIAEAIVGDAALDALERDADARRLAADAMRRAHDHGWVVVARGDLSGSVVCHAEAFFDSMAAAEHSAHAIDCPTGTVLEWSPGLTPDQYEPGGNLVPVPLAGAQLPGPRFTPRGRELVVIDTDGLETLCANPDEALAHVRTLIEDLAVRLARQYPDQEELPAEMLANLDRIGGEIPPGGMRLPLFHDTATDKDHALHLLWADSLRWQGFKRALERPDRPDLSDPQIGGPLARRLALEGFDEARRPT
ncbi:MAG: hypothetical protein ACRDPC_16515 [Solirubrobacteraceae bacterium]